MEDITNVFVKAVRNVKAVQINLGLYREEERNLSFWKSFEPESPIDLKPGKIKLYGPKIWEESTNSAKQLPVDRLPTTTKSQSIIESAQLSKPTTTTIFQSIIESAQLSKPTTTIFQSETWEENADEKEESSDEDMGFSLFD